MTKHTRHLMPLHCLALPHLRECLQIIVKCEGKVTSLQTEHVSKLAEQDAIIHRSKDAIQVRTVPLLEPAEWFLKG